MSPRSSKPSHQIKFFPRTRHSKKCNSRLSLRRSDSSSGSSLLSTGSASPSSIWHSPPPSSQSWKSPRRPRDSLAAFKSSDSLVSLRTSVRQSDGLPLHPTNSPQCVINKTRPQSLALFKPAKEHAEPSTEKVEEPFNPFEYFPPWYVVKGVWWVMTCCVGTVEKRGRKC